LTSSQEIGLRSQRRKNALAKINGETPTTYFQHLHLGHPQNLHCISSVEAMVAISSAGTVTTQPCSIFLALHCAARCDAISCHSWHFMAAAATLFDFWITSETEFSAQSRLLADGSSVGATQRKLPTDRPSWCNGSCSRQVQPTALTLHAGSCPSASSRRALAAWREARRRCRGHRDHHLDQALVRDASSPGHSCSPPPG
jgi:hypothetical protein